MPDYNNGKIYKIIDSENKVIYIGSTTEKLCNRYAKHKHKAIGNKIILIELCPCNSREELVKREQELIEQYDNLLNKFRAHRTEEYKKEYDKNNKKQHTEQHKKYYQENIDKVKEKKKLYRENNKNKISEKDKKYYQENKSIISEKRKVTVLCVCGCEIRKSDISRHMKSKKHIKLMNTITI